MSIIMIKCISECIRQKPILTTVVVLWVIGGFVWPLAVAAYHFDFIMLHITSHTSLVISTIVTRLFDFTALVVLLYAYFRLRRVAKTISEHEAQLEVLVDQRTTELKETVFKLEILASTDHLTKLANRRKLKEVLRSEFNRTQRSDVPFSVIMFDIDYFKKINDRYGHEIGDEVLRTLALELKKVVRDIDTLGRYGGEEFLIILPETELAKAYEIAERLRIIISDIDVNGITISASFGVADSNGSTTTKEILELVDTAMYRAKHTGRNKVVELTNDVAGNAYLKNIGRSTQNTKSKVSKNKLIHKRQ